MSCFSLHNDFQAKIRLGSLPLCEVLLEPNRHYPWLILVPRVAGALRLLDLPADLSAQLWQELHLAQTVVWGLQPLTQLNVGQLGNRCPQLHLHVVGRRADDPAWPGPVWGHPTIEAYRSEELDPLRERLQLALTCLCDRFLPADQKAPAIACPP